MPCNHDGLNGKNIFERDSHRSFALRISRHAHGIITMWLINVRTLKLEEFAHAGAVKYAILSHTWGAEEVTFQEFRSVQRRDEQGYSKIQKTCKQALKDGLDYAWVDSCCINKESSAELAKAINSMWQWYYEAEVCYTFLSDLNEQLPDFLPGLDGETELRNSQLARCRWFTRGWTLQELLASNYIRFFNSRWECLGSKHSLAPTISAITGIDETVLQSRDRLFTSTIARKMSWAAGRQTKYVEDRAYSLMGMFGVNMPLLYGEGEGAFTRLQEEIIKTSTDLSIFVWEPLGTKEEQAKADLLFASSPDQFHACGNVVQWQGFDVDRHFQMTNRGVMLDRKLVRFLDSGTFLVLNCRLQDDFRGPLALRLCKRSELSSTLQENIGRGEYLIDIDYDHARGDTWSLHSRLAVYAFGDFDTWRNSDSRAILLRWHPVMLVTTSTAEDNTSATTTVWLKPVGPKKHSEPIRLLEASPSRFWNPHACTMTFSTVRFPITVSSVAKIYLEREDLAVFVAFSVTVWNRGYVVPGGYRGKELQVALSTFSESEALESLDHDVPGMRAYLSLGPTRRLKARVKLERQTMGDVVFVMKFFVKDEKVHSEPKRKSFWKRWK